MWVEEHDRSVDSGSLTANYRSRVHGNRWRFEPKRLIRKHKQLAVVFDPHPPQWQHGGILVCLPPLSLWGFWQQSPTAEPHTLERRGNSSYVPFSPFQKCGCANDTVTGVVDVGRDGGVNFHTLTCNVAVALLGTSPGALNVSGCRNRLGSGLWLSF